MRLESGKAHSERIRESSLRRPTGGNRTRQTSWLAPGPLRLDRLGALRVIQKSRRSLSKAMKPKTILHLPFGAELKTPSTLDEIIRQMDQLPQNGTVRVDRLTAHGSLKKAYIPAPNILRLEEA